MNFGTCNVQGITQKVDIIAFELNRINRHVVAMTETKKVNICGGFLNIKIFTAILGFKLPEILSQSSTVIGQKSTFRFNDVKVLTLYFHEPSKI